MRLYFIIINIRTIPIENVIYRFYIADYLGNNRVVFDQAGNIEQVNHYYPYGGVFAEGNRISTQPYKFGGKELDRMNGLDTYDFGARQLDYALPSWTAIDPKAEKYYSISPYAYCAGNPIANIDPDGTSTFVVRGADGLYTVVGGDLNDGDYNIYMFTLRNGKITRTSIGVTTSITSFYDSDTGK